MAAVYDRKRQNALIMQSKSAYLKRHYGNKIRIVQEAPETVEAMESAVLPIPGHLASANKVPLPAMHSERTTHDAAGNLLSRRDGKPVTIEQSGFVSYDSLLMNDIAKTTGSPAPVKFENQAVGIAASATPPAVTGNENISILDVLEDF